MTDFFQAAWTALAPIFGAQLGGVRCTVSRPYQLKDVAALRMVGELVLAAPAFRGDTTLLLALASGGVIQGKLPAGISLFLGGESLMVTADAPASGASFAASFSPPLPVPFAAGAAVSLGSPGVSVDGCIVSQAVGMDVAAKLSADIAAKVALPIANCPPGWSPRLNDLATLAEGDHGLPVGLTGRIASVPPSTGGWYDTIIGWNTKGGSSGSNP